MGYLASKAIPESFKTIFKANPDPPLATSPYPPFNKALALAQRLGVCPLIETIKTLEINEIAKARKEEEARPSKRPRANTPPIEPPRGRALGQKGSPKGKERAKDDEVVSLYSEDETMAEVDPQEEEQVDYGDLDTQDYNLDGELADLTGIYNDYWQVQSPETNQGADLPLQQLGTLLVSCNISCLPCSCECDCKTNEPVKEWILDSGASLHFTNDIDDFIDYEVLEGDNMVRTANSVAQMIGKGTVLLALATGEVVRIYPVYHIPSLTFRLLSMGTFLQNGLKVLGSSQKISLEERSNSFLTFIPRSAEDTIYIVRSLIGSEMDTHKAFFSIYGIDYEIMHKRMAHPSKEVLQKAWKHLKGFPEIEFPKEEHLCPGCAQGKMTNRSFPPSTRRASLPFQLIHSDLKSFPIESYHKHRYVIVFVDDYTSFMWTVNLRTKDAALTATKHFIALVENRFDTRIVQWISDAGGEYKSKAFDQMLKDRGIEILQSIPYAHQQNGRAERAIRTIMDKAESIRLQACLPQSW